MGNVALALFACVAGAALAREAARSFAARDAREADAIVRAFVAPGGRGTLPDAVARDARGSALAVRAESVSVPLREARVHFVTPRGEDYAFDVALGDRSIHPANPAAERVLRALLAPGSP